jgi:hypothetical protein
MERWRSDDETTPPRTEDLSRWLDLTSPDSITLIFNDRHFRVPPGTRYIRHGLTQEGFSVDYQDADGDWHGAEEFDDQPLAPPSAPPARGTTKEEG